MASKQNVVAVLTLLNAATVWGLIWYPFRALAQAGIPGETATFLTYFIALLFGLAFAGPVWRELRIAGWWGIALTLCAGWTNYGYVLATLDGEVMRVLLLFYLAPLWTVLLSRALLDERLDRHGYAIVALSLCGAFVMLWQPETGLPLPRNAAEWIGLSSGFCFAMTNVLVRKVDTLSINFKSAGVWFGTALLSGFSVLHHGGFAGQVQGVAPATWGLLVVVALVVCATSFSVQYGLVTLPANQAILLFMFELVVAAVSSYFLAGEEMAMREGVGAGLIVAASVWSGRVRG